MKREQGEDSNTSLQKYEQENNKKYPKERKTP